MERHQSFFTYNLTRPYPFRLYSPILVLLFVILLAPVTFINVATSGFDLVTQTSLDPNSTVSQLSWNSWLSGLVGNIQATCQPAVIDSNSQIFTNNSALTYTMTSALNYTFNATDQVLYLLPSLSNQLNYMNNPMVCSVGTIELSFDAMSTSPAQLAVQKQGLELTAYVNCAFGATAADFTAKYDYIPSSQTSIFPGRQNFGNSSLLLGEALLRMYWQYTTYVFYQQNVLQDNPYSKAWLSFSPTENPPAPNVGTYQISSPEFFNATGQFFTFSSSGAVPNSTVAGPALVPDLVGSGNRTILPAIWEPADALAKIFRDTVFADLGDTGILNEADALVGHNILTNTSYLELFTKNFTNMSETLAQAGPGWLPLSKDPALPTAPFTSANESQYQLVINPSTFGMSYICQVPQLKPAGALFFSVLVADLVIMQALWKLLSLVTDYYLMRKYPERFPHSRRHNGVTAGQPVEMEPLRLDASVSSSYNPISVEEDGSKRAGRGSPG